MSGNKAKQTIQEARIDSVFVTLEHLAVTWNAVDGLHYDGKHPWTEWTTCSRHFAIAATVIKNIGKITLNILPNMRHSPSSSEQQKWNRNLGIIFFLISFFISSYVNLIFFSLFVKKLRAPATQTNEACCERECASERECVSECDRGCEYECLSPWRPTEIAPVVTNTQKMHISLQHIALNHMLTPTPHSHL